MPTGAGSRKFETSRPGFGLFGLRGRSGLISVSVWCGLRIHFESGLTPCVSLSTGSSRFDRSKPLGLSVRSSWDLLTPAVSRTPIVPRQSKELTPIPIDYQQGFS